MPHPDAFNQENGHSGKVAAPSDDRNNVAAITWLLASVLAASAMTVAVRQASLEIDTRMIVLLRAVITLAIMAPIFLVSRRARRQLRFTRPWLHVFRGILIAVAIHFGFYTLANLPLATAAVLFFLAPIFATILAVLLQNEKVGPRRWAAVLAGFAGAAIILRPDTGSLQPAMLSAIASSLSFAGALTMSRGLASADGPTSAFLSATVITTLISIPLALPVMALPTGGTLWFTLLILVITGAVRGYADIQAYRLGEASVLAPITYLRLVLITTAGFFFFGEKPGPETLLGAAIIVAATLYIALREARLRKS